MFCVNINLKTQTVKSNLQLICNREKRTVFHHGAQKKRLPGFCIYVCKTTVTFLIIIDLYRLIQIFFKAFRALKNNLIDLMMLMQGSLPIVNIIHTTHSVYKIKYVCTFFLLFLTKGTIVCLMYFWFFRYSVQTRTNVEDMQMPLAIVDLLFIVLLFICCVFDAALWIKLFSKCIW